MIGGTTDVLRNAIYRCADSMGWPVVRLRSGVWISTMNEWAKATAVCKPAGLKELADALLFERLASGIPQVRRKA